MFKKMKLISLALAVILMMTACGNKKEEEKGSMDLGKEATADNQKDQAADADKDQSGTDSDAAAEVDVAKLAVEYFHNMPDHIYKIDQKEFVDKVKAGDEMVILDIRTAEDYAKGHVKGAISVPWGPAIAENLSKIPQDKEVMVYCYSGQTAGQAVMTLNIAGINARSVNFGWNLGISKVDGVADVTTTEATEFGSDSYQVAPAVQEALTAYYNGLAEVKGTTYANYKISEDDLNQLMVDKADFYLLSIRSAKDYAKEHIEGAKNVPFNKELMDNLGDMPKDKKVVVYCYSGQTAGQTVAAMRLAGYDAVSLNGGIGVPPSAPNGWKNHDYPVVSGDVVSEGAFAYFANMPEHIYKIKQQDFVDKVKAGDEMVILDIRKADAYEKGHVKGAINLPWGPAIAENLNKIPQDKEVMVYCYTGQTAGQAVMTLNLAGINARSVNLGYMLGIEKVDGVNEVIVTEASQLGDQTYPVDEAVQAAVTAYYNGLAEVKDTTYANYKISEDDLNQLITDKADFYLLSIRKPEDYAKGHIAGAKNVPFNKDMMVNLTDVPKDKKVVVYCYTGQTAGQAVAAMRLVGYDAVSLNGGAGMEINAPHGWTNHGYSLVTE